MIKTKTLLLLFALSVPAFLSFDERTFLNKPMPTLPGETLDGKTVDEHYYKGHLTLVTFMYIGCPPCMNEIGALNRLKTELAGDDRFQILCVARQTRTQMLNFSGINKSTASSIRRAQGADSIQYDVLPACGDVASKMDSTIKRTITGKDTNTEVNIRLNTECDIIQQVFGITAYPAAFWVDENGTIKKISQGGPSANHDNAFYTELKAEADSMLQRQHLR